MKSFSPNFICRLVPSGLARGIDGCAHRGALEAGGRTIGVLASGLKSIYPPEHKDLADQVQKSGALLTEYNMQMEPLPVLFPMRNRIISGLSRAVVVIEANKQSGALITTKHAAEQGREVFALPGPVDSLTSAGTLELLRNGARLIRSADDILEDLKGISPLISTQGNSSPSKQNSEPATLFNQPTPEGLDETQRRIWDFLSGHPRYQDELAQELELNISQLSGTLLLMEMKKIIRRLPGNRFERF